MDYISKLGYRGVSPFNNNALNTINLSKGDFIDMTHTSQPLLALQTGKIMKPGKYYSRYQSGGNSQITEVPMDSLAASEKMLLEKHLSTLSQADKNIFMDTYSTLDDSMRQAAIAQMATKYPEVVMQVVSDLKSPNPGGYMQNGGMNRSLSYPSLRGSYQPMAPSTLSVSLTPIAEVNYNQQFLDFATPAANMARKLTLAGKFDEAKKLRDQITSANNFRGQMEAIPNLRPGELPLGSDLSGSLGVTFKNGGLSAHKAEKMLHDGTVRGHKITDKQRRYFAAVAFSKNKKYEDGGTAQNGIQIKESHKGMFSKAAKEHGMTAQQFAGYVLAHKEMFQKSTAMQAQFAKNSAGWDHSKKQNGGQEPSWNYVAPPEGDWAKAYITSNRPGGNNVVNLKAAGNSNASNNSNNSNTLRRQGAANNPTLSGSKVVNPGPMGLPFSVHPANPNNPVNTNTYSWSDNSSSSFNNPNMPWNTWMNGGSKQVKTLPTSNITRAIANLTGDPIYNVVVSPLSHRSMPAMIPLMSER